jgi:subtilisin family serine protease
VNRRRLQVFGLVGVAVLLFVACTPEPPAPPPPPSPDGTIVAWVAPVGAIVKRGDVLATLSFAGTPGTLVSPEDGRVGSNRVPAGGTFTPGTVVAELVDPRASFSTVASYVTIAAPGAVIASTVAGAGPAGYAYKSGTSMATPYVSAAIALLRAKCGEITPAQIRAVLTSTAEDLGAPGTDSSFGAGLLHVDDALAAPCPPALGVAASESTTAEADGSAATTPSSTSGPSGTTSPTAATLPTTTTTTAAVTTTEAPPASEVPAAATETTPVTGLADTSNLCRTPVSGASGSEASGSGDPTLANADSYFAVVEDADGQRHVETFHAKNSDEKHEEVDGLRRRGLGVVSVEMDSVVVALSIDDPMFLGPPFAALGPQWGVNRVGFEAAWGNVSTLAQGQGIRVAVLDSGVYADHEDLGRTETGGNVAPGADCVTTAPTPPGDGRADSGTHGTHVAGILAARDNNLGGIGGAPKATIVPVQVLSGGTGNMSDVVAGIYWAANPAKGNADVISMSLGGGNGTGLSDALDYAASQKVTVVAAAGNDGRSGNTLYPAAYASSKAGVIAVAATAQRLDVPMPKAP